MRGEQREAVLEEALLLQAVQIRRTARAAGRTAAAEPKRPKDAWDAVLSEAAWMANAFRRCCLLLDRS